MHHKSKKKSIKPYKKNLKETPMYKTLFKNNVNWKDNKLL